MYLDKTGLVSIELIHDGQTLIKHAHEGQNYVQAPLSGNYSIRLKSNHYQRVLVVISVDGRNIMDGEEASYDGGGYVLHPGQTWDIKGWRRTNEEVAAFEFVDLQNSYDKQMGGSGSNVGVIGAAVFIEKPKYILHGGYNGQELFKDYYLSSQKIGSKSMAGSSRNIPLSSSATNDISWDSSTTGINAAECAVAHCSTADSDTVVKSSTIGTGYGEKQAMLTQDTVFTKVSETPTQVISLRYASRSMLEKWGVITLVPAVNPFPREKISCPAPANWRG